MNPFSAVNADTNRDEDKKHKKNNLNSHDKLPSFHTARLRCSFHIKMKPPYCLMRKFRILLYLLYIIITRCKECFAEPAGAPISQASQ